MRYADIYPFDISNGPGIRVSLFVQGCDKHCPGCFNSETWDFSGGKKYDHEVNNYLMSLCNHDYVSGLSILGGEPLNPENIDSVVAICTQFKKLFPNKTIWIWTGYTFEELAKRFKDGKRPDNMDIAEILFGNALFDREALCDVIIDGPFIESKKDLSLKWRGSSNQRIWRRGGKKMSESSHMWYCEG